MREVLRIPLLFSSFFFSLFFRQRKEEEKVKTEEVEEGWRYNGSVDT